MEGQARQGKARQKVFQQIKQLHQKATGYFSEIIHFKDN